MITVLYKKRIRVTFNEHTTKWTSANKNIALYFNDTIPVDDIFSVTSVFHYPVDGVEGRDAMALKAAKDVFGDQSITVVSNQSYPSATEEDGVDV